MAKKKASTVSFGLFLCLAFLTCQNSPCEEEWAGRFARRRAVVEVQRVPDSPAAYVEFFSAGQCDQNGADIRLFDEKGNAVPHRIMSVGPGDRFLIAFKLTESNKYFLYYSQPTAAPVPSWDPQCGVFLRTYSRPSGTSNSVAEIEAMVRSVRFLLGSGYRPMVFDGYNPYGNSDDYVSIYIAYLRIPKSGTYSFATNSDDSSAFYLDGKLVADFPGVHAAVARKGERSGSLQINEGIHLLTYYHVEYIGPQSTTAAWKQPGEEFFTPIPAEAFVPISPSSVTAVEEKQRGRVLDFSFGADEIYVPEGAGPLIGVKFQPFSLSLEKGCVFLWDFGDGERSNEKAPTHIYLRERLFPISLTVVDDENKRHAVSHYVPAAHIEGRNTDNPGKTKDGFHKILSGYTCQKLSADELETLHDFYAEGEGNESQLSTLSSLLLNVIPATQPEKRAKFLLSWSRANKKSGARNMQLQRARFYEEAAKITRARTTRAEALLELGDVHLFSLGDGNAALNCYRTVIAENADAKLTRRAVIRQGDVHLFSGDLASAKKFYSQAGVLPEDAKGAEALRTSYGNLIEGYIKQNDLKAALDAIETWEWKYPMVKTGGYPLILRARIAFSSGNMTEVQRLSRCIVETLEEDSFKPEAYYLLISSLLRQGQGTPARQYYQALLDRFPRDRHVDLLRRSFP